ncbi:MAG: DUF1993 domain-containing protein [Polyangiaceae bacterium]
MNSFDMLPQFSKMLRNLDAWLDKAQTFAKAKNMDADTFMNFRLAPDMYPLVKQVQSACDSAKFSAAYFSGKEAPAHPDTETTMAEARERIAKCLAFLETVSEKDCAGMDEKKISPKWAKGGWLKGDHYALQVAIPNFYFHVTTAYAILRHNGVDVGKMDYMGAVPFKN